jgi:sugar/nucleoside kinase (ribokinase family)
MTELDVLTLGMMMGEVAPPRLGVRVGEAERLVLFPSGSATIFAMALARLGGRVGLISRVGDDELGGWMRQSLARAGIDTAAVSAVSGQLTPLALASVDERGDKSFSYYRFPGTCDPLATLQAEEIGDDVLRRATVFDFTEGSLRSPELRGNALRLAERARGLGLAVCYNPNYRESAWADGAEAAVPVQRRAIGLADLAIMNAGEARLIAGEAEDSAATRWLSANGPGLTIITRGGDPLLIIAGGAITEVPAVRAEVVFDIGAGDAFHAGFLAVWRPGGDPIPCARFAAQAAALKIGRPPQPEHLPTRAEVLAKIKEATE